MDRFNLYLISSFFGLTLGLTACTNTPVHPHHHVQPATAHSETTTTAQATAASRSVATPITVITPSALTPQADGGSGGGR